MDGMGNPAGTASFAGVTGRGSGTTTPAPWRRPDTGTGRWSPPVPGGLGPAGLGGTARFRPPAESKPAVNVVSWEAATACATTGDVPEIADEVGAARTRRAWERSPTIGRLSPLGDARVARVVARHHALELEWDHDVALAGTTALLEVLLAPLVACRKATMGEAARARETARRLVARRGDAIHAGIGEREGRPRFDPHWGAGLLAVDTGHLCDDGIGLAGIVQVRATQVAASRSCVTAGWHPIAASWRQHAAERVLERSPGRGPGNVHLALARELTRLAPAIALMSSVLAASDPDAQLAVPFEGGLLLGSIDVVQPGVAVSGRLSGLAIHPDKRVARHLDVAGRWAVDLGAIGPATWTAITYVGPEADRPDRDAYAADFAAATSAMSVDRTAAYALSFAQDLLEVMERDEDEADRVARSYRESVDVAGGRSWDGDRSEAVADALGFDPRAVKALALDGIARGVAKVVPQGRDACARVPIRRRDHDDEPFRRAWAALAARGARKGR